MAPINHCICLQQSAYVSMWMWVHSVKVWTHVFAHGTDLDETSALNVRVLVHLRLFGESVMVD